MDVAFGDLSTVWEATSSPSKIRSYVPPPLDLRLARSGQRLCSERDAERDLGIPGITVDEFVRSAIELSLVHGAAADIHPARLRHVVGTEPTAHLVVVIAIRHERPAVKDAGIWLDHWHHVEHVTGFGAQALQNGIGEEPRFVVEADLEPVDDEVT